MNGARKMMVMLLFVLVAVSAVHIHDAVAKDKCYQYFYSWSCLLDDNFDYKTWDSDYYRLKDDGTFETTGGYSGLWYLWKGSLVMKHHNGCKKIAIGKKNLGFVNCTDGTQPSNQYVPGCWVLKKTKCTVFESE